jgi:hypothetical protein
VSLIFDFLPPSKFTFLSDKRERSFLEKLLCAKKRMRPGLDTVPGTRTIPAAVYSQNLGNKINLLTYFTCPKSTCTNFYIVVITYYYFYFLCILANAASIYLERSPFVLLLLLALLLSIEKGMTSWKQKISFLIK